MPVQNTIRAIPDHVVTSLLAKPVRKPGECAVGQHPSLGRLGRQCLARVKAAIVGTSYDKGTVLFSQEELPKGVYLILEGSVRLSISSSNGRSLVLGLFGPGTALGLEGTILGWPHMVTAEVVEPAKLAFMERQDLLRHLIHRENAAFEAAELASETCYFLMRRIQALQLSESAEEKLLWFLSGLRPEPEEQALRLHVTQEAVAQMIGSSRETVARLLSRLKRKRILDWKRSTLIIRNLDTLRKYTEARHRFGERLDFPRRGAASQLASTTESESRLTA